MKTPLYTYQEALQLTESLIDQDTKFNREVEALINTEEAKEILINAYNSGDDSAKASIAAATEEQFLDKYAPDGSAKDKDEKKDDGSDSESQDADFLDDASGLEDAPEVQTDDNTAPEDSDGSEDIDIEDGSEDDQDTAGDEGIGTDNPFAQATSGDESGALTDTEGDNSGNPFLESKKAKKAHSLNESRAAARKVKTMRANAKKMNEAMDPDEVAQSIDEQYYGKIWKFLEGKLKKFASARERILFLKRVQSKPEVTRGVAEKIILKNSIDLSAFGKEGLTQFMRVVKSVAGDLDDLGEY